MGPKPKQPIQAPAVAQPPAVALHTSGSARGAAPVETTTEFDATRAIDLQFRHVIPGVDKVLADKSPQRQGMIAFAASDFARTLDEVSELAHRQQPTWDSLRSVVDAATYLHARLKTELDDNTRADLEQSWKRFAAIVSVTGGGAAASLRALSDEQLAELTVQLAAAASVRLDTTIEGAFDDPSIDASCTAITLDLQSATDAAASIVDRRLRTSLHAKFGRLWTDLDKVEAMLVTTPKRRWQASIARMFDAELVLRKIVGRTPAARAYSGGLDPGEARKQVMGVASGAEAPASACDLASPDPSTAVDAIMIDLASLYDRQALALDRLQADLGEQDVPETSLAGAILSFIVTEVFNVVGVHVGNALSAALGKALSRGGQVLASNDYLSRLLENPEAKQRMLATAFKTGPAWHAYVGETAKQLMKDSFKLPGDAVGAAVKKQFAQTVASSHIAQYCIVQKEVLADLKKNGLLVANHLRPALMQLELSQLDSLGSELCDAVPRQVEQLRYGAAMRGWLRFEAEVARGGAVAGHGRDDSPTGVVETTVIAQDGELRFHRMRLVGDRPAARRYLHRARIALPSADQQFHARFQLACYWGSGGHKDVFIGVLPNGNVDVESLDSDELVLLRALAGGGRIDDRTIADSRDGTYALVPNVVDRVMSAITALKLDTQLLEAE